MFLRAGGLCLHLRDDGPREAPPLLMLHSLGTSHAVWEPQAAALARQWRVIRPDLRGHGLSEVPPGPYTIEAMAADMLAALDGLGIASAHVAGLSIGGLVAQSIAHQAPARVRSLILCDTALAIPPAQSWRDRAAAVRREGTAAIADAVLARWVTPGFLEAPEALGLLAMLLRTAPEGYAGAAEAIAAADFSRLTASLRLPALVLVGEHDAATPPASAAALAASLDARLMTLADAAHIPTVEQPDAVTDAIAEFLAAQGAAFPADPLALGMSVRRAVLGDAHVDAAIAATTPLDEAFQAFITRTAWAGVWSRRQFDRRTRSIVTLALLAALGHEEEFALHVRATANTGATEADIAELLLHVAVYAGIPAANAAMRVARRGLAARSA